MWKIGCGVMLLGFALSVSSCGLFARAFQEASGERSIAVLEHAPRATTRAVEVDPGARIRLDFAVDVRLMPEDFARVDSTSAILQTRLPIDFRVHDGDGRRLARGAEVVTGSRALAAADHPSRARPDSVLVVRWRTGGFEVGDVGTVIVTTEIPSTDEEGRRVTGVRTTIYDNVSADAGRFGVGGAVSMLLGPVVAISGTIVFAIGLLVRARRREETA